MAAQQTGFVWSVPGEEYLDLKTLQSPLNKAMIEHYNKGISGRFKKDSYSEEDK